MGSNGQKRDGPMLGMLAEPAAAAAALLLYVRTIGYGFVLDDLSLIGPDGPVALGGEMLPYRPLRYLSYRLDHLLGAGTAAAYHATNVVLHALVAVVVVRLARRVGAGSAWALVAGLFLALHPLAVEAVAYVAGRRDLLSTLLGCVAVLAWTSNDGRRTAVAVVAVLSATAAKETGILFLAVLALASMAGLGPRPRAAVRILALAAVAAVALPVAYGARGPIVLAGSLAAKLAASAELAAHYAGTLVAPTHLAVDYPHLHHAGAGGLAGAAVLGGLLVLAAAAAVLSGFVWRTLAARRSPAAGAFCAAWLALFTVAIATVIGMHEPGADRHAYPLLVAVALCISAAGAWLGLSRVSTVGALVALGCVVVLAGLSWRQVPLWRNQWTLWSATVAAVPQSARAHHNLAGLLVAAGAHGHAREHLRAALRAEPSFAPAQLGLAAIWCERGRPLRARRNIAAARRLGMPAAEVGEIEHYCAQAEARR